MRKASNNDVKDQARQAFVVAWAGWGDSVPAPRHVIQAAIDYSNALRRCGEDPAEGDEMAAMAGCIADRYRDPLNIY